MDGVLIDLLNAKWHAFVKSRFYRQFFLFLFYFLISLVCFTLRPGPPMNKSVANVTGTNITQVNITIEGNGDIPYQESSNYTILNANSSISKHNTTEYLENYTKSLVIQQTDNSQTLSTTNNSQQSQTFKITKVESIHEEEGERNSRLINLESTENPSNRIIGNPKQSKKTFEHWWKEMSECRLLQINNNEDMIRLATEVALEVGAILYIVAALREAQFLGCSMFVENLMTAPSRVMFLFSCLLMISMPLLRFSCHEEVEDIMAVIIMLTTAPYFLFFCRGFKTVGPFVVMIYRMIMGDLLRFATIYLVFVMGFSQAYYIIFLSFDNPLTPDGVDDSLSNPMPNPVEAVMAMFFMSLTNFGDYYTSFEKTEHEIGAKFCFVVYMAIVAILLVNMLIAMMGNTYQKIAETRNEWQRQWARIVLVVERGVSPSERLTKLMWYSQPMSDGRRALVLRLNQSEEDKEEMKEILEMKRIHNRMVQKRLQGKKPLSSTPSPKKLIDLNSPIKR